MASQSTENVGFRDRLIAKERLVGTFIKTPTSHACEILGALGMDFVVIDEEHAPFDRAQIDSILLGCLYSGIAGLVRVSEPTAARILSALDCGATGVLVPHVNSAEKARKIAAATRFGRGNRGFSNSPRAGGYGTRMMAEHIRLSDAAVTLIAMIEDVEALDEIDEILAVEDLDGVFIGRGDLAVAMKAENANAPEVTAAVEQICAAAKRRGKPVAVMVGSAADSARFRAMGASAFIVSSDQGLMKQAAAQVLRDFAEL